MCMDMLCEKSEDERCRKTVGVWCCAGQMLMSRNIILMRNLTGFPDAIKEELHIICVLFTEEVGGIFTIVLEEDGSVSLETDAYEEDILYDEISSGLLVREIRMQRQELLEALSLYYRVFVLQEQG